MEQEKEFEQFLGGAPKEVVQEFKKPGELSEEELMGVLGGNINREVAVESQMQNADLFRPSSVEMEKEAMLQELAAQQQEEFARQKSN